MAKNNGALAGKISGAGGGGFMMFIVNPVQKPVLKKQLLSLGGEVSDVQFSKLGTESWRAD